MLSLRFISSLLRVVKPIFIVLIFIYVCIFNIASFNIDLMIVQFGRLIHIIYLDLAARQES